MKIGELVQTYMGTILHQCTDNELSKLRTAKYSKDAFGINYAFCAEIDTVENARYYKAIHDIRGKALRVCSQWREGNRERFCHYMISRNLADQDALSAMNDLPERSRGPSKGMVGKWPYWSLPSNDELLQLAKITVPYIRFLHPDIVRDLVKDNESRREEWSDRLKKRGIDPSLYLWENSSCAFPGVRRHAGRREVSELREKTKGEWVSALAVDDNVYPKHIWSFVFRKMPFTTPGPSQYSLAHLVDHKKYKNRAHDELNYDGETVSAMAFFWAIHQHFECGIYIECPDTSDRLRFFYT